MEYIEKKTAETYFHQLNLIEPITRALEELNYTNPTPIQEQAIPEILKGRDVLGCAQTGTGKTAAFTVPLLNNLIQKKTQVGPKQAAILILSPP